MGRSQGSGQTSLVGRGKGFARLLKADLLALPRLEAEIAAITRRLDDLDLDVLARLERLESVIQQMHSTDREAAGERHTSVSTLLERVNELLSAHNQTTWDSDRQFHDSLLRRLATIERAVRSSGPPRAGTDVNSEAIATNLRDFLGVGSADDPPSVLVNVGPMEVQIPAWDTVILPWLKENSDWEPAVAEALRENATPGDVVLDVGAHVGIFTLALSKLVGPEGRVVAVEADPVNARFLRRNVMRSHCDNVIVLDVAAADRTGVVKLSRSIEENTGDSRTYEVATAGEVLEVPALALDDVLSGPLHLVKIDLQGTDHVAMRGMSRIIRECRPTIVTEYWPDAIRAYGDDPVKVLSWFRELGYSWTALEAPEVTDGLSDKQTCDAAQALPTGYFNLVLRPTVN